VVSCVTALAALRPHSMPQSSGPPQEVASRSSGPPSASDVAGGVGQPAGQAAAALEVPIEPAADITFLAEAGLNGKPAPTVAGDAAGHKDLLGRLEASW
jgi:hypothetical protein